MAILALPFPTYQPAMRVIASITKAFPAVITTTFAHQYETGMIARLNVPLGFGMVQVNQLYGPITVTNPTTFTMAINTTTFDAFATPADFPFSQQYAQVTIIGEVNETILYAEKNVLPYSAQ